MEAWPNGPELVQSTRSNAGISIADRERALPILLTVDEAADLLRTTRRAIYAMVERGQLPGVVRVRRRVLLRTTALLHWLEQKCAPSPEE
jgi:excisionase family DNA binding protein